MRQKNRKHRMLKRNVGANIVLYEKLLKTNNGIEDFKLTPDISLLLNLQGHACGIHF